MQHLVDAQEAWKKLGYGMFIHFGPNTLSGQSWGDGTFRASDFRIPDLNTDQWAETAKTAGMTYAVLTTKHHDGFCLWPTDETDYSVRAAATSTDIVESYVRSFSEAGLKVGLYYSLWDQHCACYDDDQNYAKYMQRQVRELLTRYGDVVELWFDGAWDKDHPTRKWPYDSSWEDDPESGLGHGERWAWPELYDLIHELQPNCLVINNSSSDRGGHVRYQPVDIRTCEHFDFIHNGQLFPTKLNDENGLPLEYCTTLNPGWFYKHDACYSHPSSATIQNWLQTARSHDANLLLNVGPDHQGLIPDYHRQFLHL